MTAGFALPRPIRRRRTRLTPMIDVVFLLLVFFLLAARFGADQGVSLATAGGGGASYDGPPRLLEIGATELHLNGSSIALEGAAAALRGLMTAPDDLIVLRPSGDVQTQRLVVVMSALTAAGLTSLVVIE